MISKIQCLPEGSLANKYETWFVGVNELQTLYFTRYLIQKASAYEIGRDSGIPAVRRPRQPPKCLLLHRVQKTETKESVSLSPLDPTGWRRGNGVSSRFADTVRPTAGDIGKGSFTLGGVMCKNDEVSCR